MRNIDLGQFQFDYDLTWSAIFLNPNGIVYGRYGSQTHRGPMDKNSMTGLKSTLKRVLSAHKDFPSNLLLHRDKKGPKPLYKTSKDIPSPKIKRIFQREGKEGCVHCHNIWDGHHDALVIQKKYNPKKLWKYPHPENVGWVIDKDQGIEISKVIVGSFADAKGMKKGDVLQSLNGQAIYSIADIQFVLQFLKESSKLDVVYQRKGKTQKAQFKLSGHWRETPITWRGSLWGMPPAPGLWCEEIDNRDKRKLGIQPSKLGIKIRGVFGRDVRNAGLRKNDHIVSYDGKSDHATGAEFHSYLRFNHYKKGSVLKLIVLRNGKRIPVEVKFETLKL